MPDTPEPLSGASNSERVCDDPEVVVFDTAPQQLAPESDPLSVALAERDAHYERYLRALAEQETYRRRINKERDDERRFAPAAFLRDLLPVLDNLRRGVEAAKSASSVEQILLGFDMVLKQVDEALAKHGALPITAVGQQFDPNLHEAIQQIPSADHPAMTVLQEVERGYTLHERVIRPTKVLVSS